MADSALVTSAANVSGPAASRLAHGAVAADAHVDRLRCEADICGLGKGLVNWGKAVARVDKASIHHTIGAVVPIRAVKALVADAGNVLIRRVSDSSGGGYRLHVSTYLITAIANSKVRLVSAGSHLNLDVIGHARTSHSCAKGMHGVVAMSISGEARLAEVKVLAGIAVEEFRFREF